MARKPKPDKTVYRIVNGKRVPMKYRKDGWPEPPFKMRDVAAYLATPVIALVHEANAWWGVAWGFETSAVVCRVMKDEYCSVEADKTRRYHWQSPHVDVGAEPGAGVDHTETHLKHLRTQALEQGATPEAIRLIHGILPFTQEEMNMATEKLSKKGAAAKAPKAEKPKAPKAEKGGAEKPKRAGNPEALKKAREARETGPDTRKLTILKKENPYREGSGRASAFNALKGAKTVQDYVDAGGKKKYIARWEEEGLISVK